MTKNGSALEPLTNEHDSNARTRIMISETALMDCEDVPAKMVDRFDQPWHFLGEVNPFFHSGEMRYLKAICTRCEEKSSRPVGEDYGILNAPFLFYDVFLEGYLFITDDMIEVTIYFGVCEECDAVLWARQGPPFKRARCLVTA